MYSLDVLLSQLWTTHCFVSGSNCCFLTPVQVSQETGEVICTPVSLRIFQFVVIHTVKSFSVVSEVELDVFLELLCFLYDSTSVGNLISCSLSFLNPAHTPEISLLMYYWSLSWRILSITLLACEIRTIVQ